MERKEACGIYVGRRGFLRAEALISLWLNLLGDSWNLSCQKEIVKRDFGIKAMLSLLVARQMTTNPEYWEFIMRFF